MTIDTKGNLWVFNLNVGEGDSSIIVTPKGKVIIIDAKNPKKIIELFSNLGFTSKDEIELLVITHPHNDHYSGAFALVDRYEVRSVILSPFDYYQGTPGYWKLIEGFDSQKIRTSFLSGLQKLYPDGSANPDSGDTQICLELLGPSRGIMANLARANRLNPNHLSIIARLCWGKFNMVFAADAQMENWQHFDSEEMLGGSCSLMKAAHHGSANGTQYERLQMLKPGYVYVSSDPNGKFKLPDSIGCQTFLRYSQHKVAALSDCVGSIQTDIDGTGKYSVYYFDDEKNSPVSLSNRKILSIGTNTTDWNSLRRARE